MLPKTIFEGAITLVSRGAVENILEKFDGSDETLETVQSDLENILKQLDKKEDNSTLEELDSLDENDVIRIWSDGACSDNPGKGGWGSIVLIKNKYYEFSGYSSHTTNNIMEMTGALEAIKKTPENSKIILTTDSQYLIKGITQWIKNWKKEN